MDKRGGMNKRGSHADWAISMGIFLVYLLVLFIIIRPGIEKVHDEDVLLDIVEEKFSEDVKWVVKMTPIIVDRCDAANRRISIKINERENAWGFGVAKTDKKPAFGDRFCFDNWELKCGEGCPTIKSRTIFDLYYALKNKKDKDIEPLLEVWCTGQASESQCKVELGSTENLEGIDSSELGKLGNKNYTEVKENWNFPESKNFAIFVNKDEIIGEEPYENINVFVREWKDWYVYDDGERRETKVSIQVW